MALKADKKKKDFYIWKASSVEQASQIEVTIKKLRFFSYNFKRVFLEAIFLKLGELITHSIFNRLSWNFNCIFLNSFSIKIPTGFAIFWKLLILYVIYHKIYSWKSRRNFQMTVMLMRANILEKSYLLRCIQACRLTYFFSRFTWHGNKSSRTKYLFLQYFFFFFIKFLIYP